jgi:hypothetical protein
MKSRVLKAKRRSSAIAPPIEPLIHTIREEKVILDADLARVYGVSTKVLNQAVKRNLGRFPPDFIIHLKPHEWQGLRSQFVTSNGRRGGRRYAPYAFTEHGAIMAANLLKTKRAVQMSVFVVRAFVRLRKMSTIHRDLADRLKELEQRVGQHDEHIRAIIEAIRQLMAPPERRKRRMGFVIEEPRTAYQRKKRGRSVYQLPVKDTR